MVKKVFFALVVFYLLVLFQSSFLAHFPWLDFNFALLAVVLINFFEDEHSDSGIVCAFSAGFFLDVFFSSYIGPYVLVSVLSAVFVKMVLKNYIKVKLNF